MSAIKTREQNQTPARRKNKPDAFLNRYQIGPFHRLAYDQVGLVFVLALIATLLVLFFIIQSM